MESQDNIKVAKAPTILQFKLTPELILKIKLRKLEETTKKNLTRIYDADKAKFYADKQNLSNSTLFGPSSPTYYDTTTKEGQLAIDAVFNLTASNAKDLIYNLTGSVVAEPLIGLLPKGRFVGGKLFLYTPFKIGKGAEANVYDNGITSVLKIGTIPNKEMVKRNIIPNVIKSKYVGKIKDLGLKFSAYTLKKVKVLTKETFPKYVKKLDKDMKKAGFKRVTDPNILYRAYTDGVVVIDDLAPENIGLNWLGLPKIIDFNMQTIPEWFSLGFKLKIGGKL